MKNTVPMAKCGGDHCDKLHHADLHWKWPIKKPEGSAIKQRHQPQVAGPALQAHDLLKDNRHPDGADHEGLGCLANERRNDVSGGKMSER